MKPCNRSILSIKQVVYFLVLILKINALNSKDMPRVISSQLKINQNKTYKKPSNTSQVSVDEDYSFGHGYCDAKLNCFLPFAVCLNSNTCLCMPDYANVYIKGESVTQIFCSYKKKKIIVAGLLELFLPFGLGHFYSGHNIIGSVKFFFSLLVFMFGYLICCKHIPPSIYVILIYVIFCCAIPIWNRVDLFLFFSGTLHDGFGIPMS